MRILIVGLNFPPEPVSTGKYTGELAACLAAQRHNVRVITAPPYYPHWKIQDGYRAWRYQKEAWQCVEVQRCPLWVPRRPTGFTRLIHLATFAFSSVPALIAQLPWKPDVVLCIAPALMNAPFVLAFARLSGAKAWLHIQDFELDAAIKLGLLPGGKWLAELAERFERALLSGFDHLSTISQRMLAHLHNKGLAPNKTSLFPNWVDTNQIYPIVDDNPLRAHLGLPTDQLIVLYAGTMGKKQGLENLLETVRSLQHQTQIQFILCGDGVIRSELEVAAQGLPNVRFLPVQPIEKLNQLLNMADIHILLQKADAADLVMPSKLSGMLASGRAVIATASPQTELGQIVREVGCLVPPDDCDALAEAILELAASPAMRIELGKKGREYAVKNWDSSAILTQFEKKLLELANPRL
ncbi:MAG: glycosyltransferase WbuB [Chloroflexi bacterium]|nr:glycosyltransferase WbuB [Chloroflexota bacterium]